MSYVHIRMVCHDLKAEANEEKEKLEIEPGTYTMYYSPVICLLSCDIIRQLPARHNPPLYICNMLYLL